MGMWVGKRRMGAGMYAASKPSSRLSGDTDLRRPLELNDGLPLLVQIRIVLTVSFLREGNFLQCADMLSSLRSLF